MIESLGITQPAVSLAVRELEDSIGVALFERTARGMMPTRASVAVALRLKRALAEIRHAVADIAALLGTSRAR
ncbi:MAG TPA: LysR family transcriptional regulator [Casimicrobiaceae bacterium]